jgi:transposase-like protein
MSEVKKNHIHSEETKKKMSEARMGRIPWNKGKKVLNRKGLSEETKRHLSKIKKGIPKEKYTCPNCQREVAGASNAKRWHFDNCRLFLVK